MSNDSHFHFRHDLESKDLEYAPPNDNDEVIEYGSEGSVEVDDVFQDQVTRRAHSVIFSDSCEADVNRVNSSPI